MGAFVISGRAPESVEFAGEGEDVLGVRPVDGGLAQVLDVTHEVAVRHAGTLQPDSSSEPSLTTDLRLKAS